MKVKRIIPSRTLLLIVSVVGILISLPGQIVPREMSLGNQKLTLTETARKQIQKDVDDRTRNPSYFNILVDRMNLYFPIVERILEEQGVPDEIKFLAIQESALISDAVSVSNAVGFWQFKDFSAREVDLEVGHNLDERLNITAATTGAAIYLKKNNLMFDNWVYAVMAYNTGPTGAKKYADASKYGAKKMVIDNNTHWYVKKFLSYIIAFSPHVGKDQSENIWLDESVKYSGSNLHQIARAEKVDIEELKKYNKWLKKGEIPSGKTYTVLIPRGGHPPKRVINKTKPSVQNPPLSRIAKDKVEEPKTYPAKLIEGITDEDRLLKIPINGILAVVARVGDDIQSLSARAEISEEQFKKYNDMNSSDQLKINEFYYLQKKKKKSKIGFHITKKGESLWSISQKYGIKKSQLAKMNRMSIIDDLEQGRVLWLSKVRPSQVAIAYHHTTQPTPTASVSQKDEKRGGKKPERIVVTSQNTSSEHNKVLIHTVAKGETLYNIARRYGVSLTDILRWNNIEDPSSINVSDNIRVKAPIKELILQKETITHTVVAGETLYAISKKYNMTVNEVIELNKLNSTSLNVGQQLSVFK